MNRKKFCVRSAPLSFPAVLAILTPVDLKTIRGKQGFVALFLSI
jgi:hypothetical protein